MLFIAKVQLRRGYESGDTYILNSDKREINLTKLIEFKLFTIEAESEELAIARLKTHYESNGQMMNVLDYELSEHLC